MRGHPGFFFGCVALALAQKEHAAVDDILGMLQSSLRVKRNSNEKDVHRIEGSGVPAMQAVSRLEKMVMARVHEAVTGDDKFAGTMNASIKYLLTGTVVSTVTNQKRVNHAIAAFRKCKVKMWNSYSKAIRLEKKFWKLSQIYPECMRAEEKLSISNNVSLKSIAHMHNILKQLKGLLKAQGRSCGNICANRGNGNYHNQLVRLTRFYRKCSKKLVRTSQKLSSFKKSYKEKKPVADENGNRYKAMRDKCKLIAYLMNLAKCEAVTHMEGSCTRYQSCWRASRKGYNMIVDDVREEEKVMKIQWRALKRIQCYLNVLDEKDQAKNKEVLKGCIEMKRPSTKHLDIDYGKIPPKPVCPKDPSCPCTPHFVDKNYRIGPKQRCLKNMKIYNCAICKKKQWKQR